MQWLRSTCVRARRLRENPSLSHRFSRCYSLPSPAPPPPPPSLQPERPSFGIAFDIDGVILRGRNPIGCAPQALRRLYNDHGFLKIPFLFLTNGGGIRDSRRSFELSEVLGVQISPLQVVQGHSPFKTMVERFENEFIISVGKGEPAEVMLEYGFRKVLPIDEYAACFNDIDPLSEYKRWTISKKFCHNINELRQKLDVHSERVKAVFIVSDPVDWGRDIQILIDILRYGGLPGQEKGLQPPLYFASDDLQYQAAFPNERLGMGAFRIALESIFNRFHHVPLEYISFGKPNQFVFKNAEAILAELASNIFCDKDLANRINKCPFNTLYMIGDNPYVDVRGAKEAGHPWFSILTRTGVFRGKDNHAEFPADLAVETVEDAVDFILTKEKMI